MGEVGNGMGQDLSRIIQDSYQISFFILEISYTIIVDLSKFYLDFFVLLFLSIIVPYKCWQDSCFGNVFVLNTLHYPAKSCKKFGKVHV